VTEAGADASSLVLDATCLSHFALADRLDVLRDLLVGRRCWTTEIVIAELTGACHHLPELWLRPAGSLRGHSDAGQLRPVPDET
jgi:hypothetical protein